MLSLLHKALVGVGKKAEKGQCNGTLANTGTHNQLGLSQQQNYSTSMQERSKEI